MDLIFELLYVIELTQVVNQTIKERFALSVNVDELVTE